MSPGSYSECRLVDKAHGRNGLDPLSEPSREGGSLLVAGVDYRKARFHSTCAQRLLPVVSWEG